MRIDKLIAIAVLWACLSPISAQENSLTVDAGNAVYTIDKHIYGHFSEHLGHGIYGGLWVGEDSPIPNTRGIRNDVVAALKEISIPNLRWPGGCFADEYHWRDGIGARSERPKMVNTHWGGVVEDNAFGTHEFLDLCEQLGCEPYICGNVGSGTVEEMGKWVEYITFDGESPMANLRRKNGREAPWKVQFWGVGNENWGCGGNMSADYYADLYLRYATYCRDFGGNKLYKIGGGANTADYSWTETLMKRAANHMNGLSLHYYTVPLSWEKKGSATDFDEPTYITTLRKALFMEELIDKHSAIMDKYDPEKKVALVPDEWGIWHDVEPGTNPGFLFQQNTMRDAIVAAITLNLFNNHCDRVRIANIAQAINVLQAIILTDEERMILTPTYWVYYLYKVHHDALMLPISLHSTAYTCGDESVDAVSASASRDKDGRVHITLVNADPNHAQPLNGFLKGITAKSVSGQVLTSPRINDHNTFETPDRVKPVAFHDAHLHDNELSVMLPPKSIVLLTIE